MRTLHSRRCDPCQGRLDGMPTVSGGIASLDHRLMAATPLGSRAGVRSQESAGPLACRERERDRGDRFKTWGRHSCLPNNGRPESLPHGVPKLPLAPNPSPHAPLPRRLTITVHLIKSHGQHRAGTAQLCGFTGTATEFFGN
jgi:hypothetical protein